MTNLFIFVFPVVEEILTRLRWVEEKTVFSS
jgi:hypothetical protein